jgi:hypothetical protein
MNGLHPTVRNLILCDEVVFDDQRSVSLIRLVSTIRSLRDPPYPLCHPRLCAFIQLIECRGPGDVRAEIVQADGEGIIFQTATRRLQFPNDPLELVGLSFQFLDITFPEAGLYWVRFVYNEQPIAQQPLLLR